MPLSVDPELVTWWAGQISAQPEAYREGLLTAVENTHGPAFAAQVRTQMTQERAA